MFIEVHDSFDKARHSIKIDSIVEVLDELSEKGTHIFMNYSVSRKGFDKDDRLIIDTLPAHIFVSESYDEVMYYIRSAINAT